MYVSPNNPGALRAALKVQRGMPQLQLTVRPPAPVRDALGAASDLGVDEPEPTVLLLHPVCRGCDSNPRLELGPTAPNLC